MLSIVKCHGGNRGHRGESGSYEWQSCARNSDVTQRQFVALPRTFWFLAVDFVCIILFLLSPLFNDIPNIGNWKMWVAIITLEPNLN